MIAVVCDWGGDLSTGPSGDILVTSVQAEVQKRIIRRLLTNAGDYIWHVDYGAGLGTFVGETFLPKFIENTILDQLEYENVIAATPPPAVQVNQAPAGSASTVSVTVQYQIAGTSTGDSIVIGLGA
jgi:hypothetical protein